MTEQCKMDSTYGYGDSRAPLSTLSSGQTFFTVESLQGITTLPAFARLQSLPIERVSRAKPSTHDDSLSGSSIRTHGLINPMGGSIRENYRQPITDREPTMNMSYVTEPIREPVGHFQILNPNVAPRDLARNYQQQELVHRLAPQPRFYPHRSRPQEVFNSKLNKYSDRGLHPKFSKRAHMEIPGTKDNSMAQKMPLRPGWCSLCDVDCSTKEVLHRQHVFGKKHQSMFEKLKEEVSGDGKKPHMEQPQQLLGWCSLCDIYCGSLENLHKQHMLGKKHQLMLGIGHDPQTEEQKTPEMDNRVENILGKRKQQIKEEGNLSSKKRQKLSEKRNAAQVKQLENLEDHLEVDGESKKCADEDGQEAKNSKELAKDDAESPGEEEETVLETKDDSNEIAEPNEDDGKKENVTGGKFESPGEEEETVLETKDHSKEIAEPNEVYGKK